MTQQKLIVFSLEPGDCDDDWGVNSDTGCNNRVQEYLDSGWKIVSYQVCPVHPASDSGSGAYSGDVVVLLEKGSSDQMTTCKAELN